MGLHARYYPVSPDRLSRFIAEIHSAEGLRALFAYRTESRERGEEYRIGTSWHVLDFLVNPPGSAVPELAYAVRGREFPAPDGSVRTEPHLPSYEDEPWQLFTYISAEEVAVAAQFLSLLTRADFEERFRLRAIKHVYRAPKRGDEYRDQYVELAVEFQRYYRDLARNGSGLLISIG